MIGMRFVVIAEAWLQCIRPLLQVALTIDSTEDFKLVVLSVRLQNANATDKLNKQCSRAECYCNVLVFEYLAGTYVCVCMCARARVCVTFS